jgi:hypothetical protein
MKVFLSIRKFPTKIEEILRNCSGLNQIWGGGGGRNISTRKVALRLVPSLFMIILLVFLKTN